MGKNCPRYTQLYQETLNSPEIKQEEIKNKVRIQMFFFFKVLRLYEEGQ